MSDEGVTSTADVALTRDDEASELFIQRLYGEWTAENQAAFESRLERDFAFAEAWKRAEEGWASLDRHAEAPEVITYRAKAIAELRSANACRWLRSERMRWFAHQWKVAPAIAGLILLGTVWQLSPYGYRPGEYRTGIGEQRIVELDDHSRITIDAATRLAARFSNESRTVLLLEGQAQFSVAKDPSRPFKVIAGDRTVIAVGTVFTVEYVDRKIHVAMLEGKVAVLSQSLSRVSENLCAETGECRDSRSGRGKALQGSEPSGVEEIYLTAGEELHGEHNGQTIVTPEADLEAATAWREGKVIFRTEPLGEAVSRMNRYSRLQLEIDDASLVSKHISGVFEAGDTRGFVNALQRYLPVTADYADNNTVRLKAR
ncbi:MAG: FecR family protein [Steroidobacteraceae bacterium]